MPQENPADFPGFLETTDRKMVSRRHVDPETSSVLSSIQNYHHWLPFESNFPLTSPLISPQRVGQTFTSELYDEDGW